MQLLVDHGGYGNLGDASIVESVVLRLRDLLPKAAIRLLDLPSIRTTIWSVHGVYRHNLYAVMPFGGDVIADVPFFWRYSSSWHSTAFRITMSCLGSVLPAGSLLLYPKDTAKTTISKLSQFCGQFDALHMAGGGNLTDTFPEELFRKCCLIHAFAEQRKPVVLTGQQLGPFKSRVLRGTLARALRKVDFVGLRDPGESFAFCQKAHLDQGSFAVMGDDSLGVPPAEDSSVLELLDQYDLMANEFLALNVRFASYALKDPSCFQTMGALVDKVATFFGKPILVVPIGLSDPVSDIASGRKVADAACSARVLVMQERYLTAPLVKGVLGKAFGAIGVSYHFCTFALSQGVPAVCIYEGDYYTQKAHALAAFWGDDRLALPLEDLDVTAAARHVICVLKDQALREKLCFLSQTTTRRWRELFHQKVTDIFGAVP